MRTITVKINDDDTLRAAEDLAIRDKVELSEMIEKALQAVVAERKLTDSLPSITKKYYGSVPSMTDAEVEALLQKRREEKYGG